MKILMLGWEFPPFNTGGLGIACQGLAKSLAKADTSITFVMPKAPIDAKSDFLKLLVADNFEFEEEELKNLYNDFFNKITIKKVNSLLVPYMNNTEYKEARHKLMEKINKFNETTSKNIKIKYKDIECNNTDSKNQIENQYGKNIFEETWNYSNKVAAIASNEEFDVIHAHDWAAFQAGVAAKKISNKPLVVHIHNTSFDRSGGNPHEEEYNIEREGFNFADKIIAISHMVKNTVVSKYGIHPEKIEVVHNGIDTDSYEYTHTKSKIKEKEKIVLFAGRVTIQKGPDYFIRAAEKILKKNQNVRFVIAGSGDMLNRCIEEVAYKNMSNKFTFTGRYTKEEGIKLMNMADVFVMPSTSEPFGLVPLEAMLQKTPTVISKQSGISEVLANTLKVDFWDTDQLAGKIMAALNYSALHEQLTNHGEDEAKRMTWDCPALKCKQIFREVIQNHNFKNNIFNDEYI